MAINDDNPLDFSSFGTPVDDGATPFDNFATPQPVAAKPRSTYGFNPDIESAIDDAAGTHGVDPDLMRTFARIESGGDPRKRTGSYNGLFMLSADEFKRFGGDADIFDPGANARAAALKFKSEEADFEKNYGRKPSASELYFLHQQGVGGADAHWRNPEAPAWENMYRTAEGRQKGPAWAKQAIWGNLPDSEKRRFGSVENITSRDFTDFWDRRVRDLSGQNNPVQVAQAPRQTMTDALDFSQFGTPVSEKPLDFTKQAAKPESDDRWEISKGFVGGFIGGNPKNFGDALVGFGHVFERPELLSRGDDIAKWGKDKLENYKARIPSFTDIRTDGVLNFLSDLGSYAGYQTGQAVASSLPSLATGAILGGTLRNPTAARVGWWAGASVPSFIQNYGDVYGSVREDEGIQKRIKAGEITEREAATWSMMAGGAMAALDTWGLEKVLGGAFKEAKADLKRRILAGMVKGAATEGPTEAMQEVISQWAQYWLGSEKTLKQAAIEVVDNFFGGVFGGGAIGGATSAIQKPAAKAEPAPDGGRVELDAAKGKVSPSAPRTTPPPLPEEGPEMSLPDVPGKPATETPPPSPEEMSVLRRMDYTEVDIRDMEPEQRAAEMEDAKSRGIVPDVPSAEPIQDIVAQARDLADPENDRRGLYLSPDNVRQIQENPDFIEQIGAALRNQGELVQNVDGNGGILLTKDAATADAVRTAIQGGQDLQQVLGEVTGAGQGKPADATAVVQQVTPEGAVTRESAVTQDQVAPTLDAFKADGRDVRAVTPEEALARREQGRTTPPPLPTEQVGDGSRQAPVRVETPEDIARAEQRVVEPTDGQKEAGNYSKGHLKFQGLDITIENPKGSIRRGASPDGTPWEVAMPTTYGYVKRSVGRDGDQVDVYVGPNPKSDRVFIIDQVDPDTGKFDEHKAMIGYNTISAARFDYEQAFSDGRAAERMGGITEMTVAKFKDWLAKGKRTRPLSKLDEKPDAVAEQPTETAAEQADVEADNGFLPEDIDEIVGAWNEIRSIDQQLAAGRNIQPERLSEANLLALDFEDAVGASADNFASESELREYLSGAAQEVEAGTRGDQEAPIQEPESPVAEGSGRPGSPQAEVVQREQADRGREGDGAGQRNAEVDQAPETGPSDSKRQSLDSQFVFIGPDGKQKPLLVDKDAAKADPYSTGKDTARDHVLTNGRKTGTEYGMVVMADGSTKPVTPSERNSKSYLEVSAKTAPDLYDGPAKSADLHHNHPKSSSFSRADYTEAAVRPALRRTWVHGHDGSEYWASFKTNDPTILGKAYDIAMAVTERLTEKGYDLPRYRTHMIATMMRDGGVIEYGATLTPARADERIATLREKFGEDAIAKAVEDIRNLLGEQDVYDRRPGSARPDRDVGSASARVDETRPEDPGSEAVGERDQAQDRGNEGGQVEPQFQAEAELESLIDDVITKQFARKGKETTGPLKIGSGDILRSQSGREMSPAPNIDATTSGRATNSIKRMNAWLHAEAIKEVDARPSGRRDILGNDAEKAQLRTVLDGIDPKKATQSDQATLNDIVFGSPEGATEANLVRRRGEKPSARKAAKAAGSAARNVIKGMDEVATGLATLFGAKANRVGSGPSFDEDTYRKAVPFFKSGISHFSKAGADIKTAVRELVSYLADTAGMSKNTILDMKPYLVRFVRDIQTGVIDPAKGDENAPDSRQGVERDRGTGRSEDSLGQARVPDERIQDGSGAQPRDGKAGKDTAPARGGSVPDGDAAAVGTGRDRGVSGRAPRDERGPAGSDRGGRGSDAGVEGVPAGRVAAEAVSGTARRAPSLKEALAAQKEADATVPFELNDPDNIRAALPALKPAQQDDVVKAEARFSQPEGHGFLLTNGTGTGKTWSGLGVVKRFVKQGKSNILIVAPSQGILDGWIDTGRMLGVNITRLPDTKTAGKGIVATTYANLGDNETLADRNWDLIVADEAHKLSQNEAGSPTDALHVLRGLTNKDPYGRARMKLAPELAKLKELEAAAKANQSLRKKYEEANTAYFQKVSDLRDELAKEPRAKALFLSATPFAYRKSTDYAEGFLFDYPELTGRYNSPGGQAEFLQRNFGYAIRYNRAEEPGPEVNVGVLEREFYERLKREGVLSGRRLEVEADYDRRFVLVDDAVGAKIDQAMNWLSSEKQGRYLPLFENILETFNYLAQRRLLEAIKAKHVVPRIKRDLELGRKVVVFHDYNEGGGFAPFAPPSNPNERVRPAYGEKEGPTIGELYSEFIKANPYVKTLDFAQFKSPIETLTTAFPEALVYNGRIPNKQRSRARDEFNLDGSGRDIIIVQSAAGEAGISLHDTTGKHQRVLYNLGLPTRPTTAIQQEGRIYREGQVSDAILRYMSTGTGWERTAFSQTIAERASTAENLALGDEARALRDAFIDAFNDADDIPQSADEGRGGKAKDRTMAGTVSPYEKAKAFYFAEGKKRGRRDQREGTDYYATPEPIGMKMVEFADVQIGERILEPSAGHGAIARWFPEGANRVLIEPSSNLASRAGLASPGAKVITSRFEDHYIGNKYDAIVMNPPFGPGGKDALDHVQKAVGHLREGGRVVAILPRGPAADKRLEAFRDSDANKNIYAALEIDLPPVMFERAGTKVATRLVVFERHSDPSTAPQTAYRDLSDAETINELFDRMENLSLSARRRENQSPAGQVPADVVEPPRKPVAPATAEVSFKLGETKHSRTGADLYVASIAKQVPRTTFDNLLATAKKHKGYYSSFRGSGAIPGFQFPTEENRTAFLQAINGGMREEADQEDFPRVNKEGYILSLPYEKEWGNPRFIKADRERAIARLREIQSINADDAPWADLVQAKRDIDQIITNLFYFSPERVSAWETSDSKSSNDIWLYLHELENPEVFAADRDNQQLRRSLFSEKNIPAELADFADEGGQAIDSLLDSKRKGLSDLLKYDDEIDPVKPKKEKPVGAIGDKMPSGFYFKAARKIDEARDTLFQMSGQAVINWLMKEGVSRAEINHFRLWDKFGGTAKFTREQFKQAIGERMFDFRRKMSWLNPERSKRDYALGGTRAFTGPRVPGQGIYFERPIAFPKKLAGGAQFPPGQFESPHWYDVLQNAWASWRGSIREVPGYGKMLVGEEGQSDYMQGASTGRRPKITEAEFNKHKDDAKAYDKVMSKAYDYVRDATLLIEPHADLIGFLKALAPSHSGVESDFDTWLGKLNDLRDRVKPKLNPDGSVPGGLDYRYITKTLRTIDNLEQLRRENEQFFAPGGHDRFSVDLSNRTPESPIDENYVRVMARDLLLLAAEKNVDSISVSTSSTTARIQNNPRAAHFYDQQMKPALERELRKLTGQWDLSLQKVALPKAMGSPKSERPYTVWAAKLEPKTLEKIKTEGVSVFSIADLPRPKVSRLDYVKGRLLLRQPVDLSEDARPIFDMMRSEPSVLPGMIPEAVITKLTPKKGTDKYIVTARDQYGEEHTFEDDAKKITRTQGQYLVANGRPLVVLTPLDFGGDFVQTVRTVRAHEAIHALRIAGFLPGGNRDAGTTWGRLVGHADLLGVLHMSRADFYKRLGDPRAATASKDVSTFEVYTTLYGHLNTGLALELYHQEAVAHMMEVYVAGGWTNQEIAPVKAILDDILSGKTAQWTDVSTMPLSAGMLRSAADNEDGALGSDRVYSLQDTITGQSMRRDLDNLGFYSKALEAARGLKQEKGTPEQMLAQLKKAGVKDAEIEATGLATLFKEKAGSTTALESDAITLSQNPQQQGDRTASPPRRARLNQISKSEIVKHLEENRVGLREVSYGADRNPFAEAVREYARKNGYSESGADGVVKSVIQLAAENNRRALERHPAFKTDEGKNLALRLFDTASTKWSRHSLDPSNPTYRETVLHLPVSVAETIAFVRERRAEAISRGDFRYLDQLIEEEQALRSGARTPEQSGFDAAQFRSGHFSEPNIIGHMMTSMTRHQGKPVYTIDQIQSDWGQALRDEVDPAKADVLREQLKAMGVSELSAEMARPYEDQEDGVGMATAGARHRRAPDYVAKELAALTPQQYSDARRIASELKQIKDQLKAPTPGHPLVNTTDQWTQTTLRRAIRQAVEAGAEYIAIPHGDTVLSYNPGGEDGMRGFYGTRTSEGIVPKNLRKLIGAPGTRVEKLETSKGLRGWQEEGHRVIGGFDKSQTGFTLFPLTEKVRTSVLEDGQPMFSMVPSAKSAVPAKIKDISRDITEAISIITRITGKDAVQIEFRDQISGAEANPAQLAASRAAGFDTRTAGGLYKRPTLDAKALIALATNDPAYDLRTAAGHEAFHHVEEVLANPAEKRLLTSDSEMRRMRALASDEIMGAPKTVLDRLHRRLTGDGMLMAPSQIADPIERLKYEKEIRAVAFQRYRRMREEGLANASRLHIGIRRLFDRMIQIFQGVRNVLKGYGYDSYEAIFDRARTGEMADPVARRASGRPVRTLRNLIDPQMRPEGYVEREPFDLKNVRLVGRAMASVPLDAIRTIQKSVSIASVRAKLGLPESDDGRPVSVFKYGNTYYVNDGNHRIEAMRINGAKTIRAEIIEIASKDGDVEVLADRGPADVQAQPVGAQEDNQSAQAGLSDSDVQASLIPAVAKVYTARWLRRLQPHTDRIRVYLQDKVLPIRRQEEAIEAASGIKLPEHLSVYTAEAIYHGRAGERLTDLQERYVEPLTQHLRKSNISFDELGDYLYARHALERNEAIRQIDPTNDAGSGMTDAEANGIVGMIEQGSRAQGFKTAAGMIDTMIKDARDTLYRAGNLTKEQYDNWTTKYKSYVPLRGFEGEVEEFGIPRVGRGMDIRGPESMQALGRRSKADNPATYVIQQSVQAIIRSEKNRVDKTLYRLIQAHPNPDVWRVFRGEAKRRINPQTGLVEMYWVPPAFAARNKDNVFGVKIAGKQHYMEILHEPLARSLRTAQPGLLGTAPGRAFYSLARFYAQLVTSFNPEFVISNYLRDIQTALMNVGDVANAPPDVRKRIRNEALSFKSIRGVMAALQSHEGRTIFGGRRAADENMLGRKRSAAAQDYAKWFEEYRLAGGKISFIEMNDIDRIKNRVEKSISEGKTRRALRNVFDLIDNANSAVENGVRLSAYIALRKNGVSQDKAAFAARELTVNFNRKGELGPGINAFYLFFNASVQGSTRLVQALTRSPAVRKGAATIILAGVLIDLLNYSIAGNDDDDENAYEKIDDWKKEKNMIVMLPGRKDYVQIPMPYGYNVLYLFGQKMAALARTAAGAGKEKPEKAIAGLLGAMVESFSPMGAAPSWAQVASPTLLDPFTQIWENKNWFGGKIAPEKLPTQKHKPDSEMFKSTAPAWAIDLARALNRIGIPGLAPGGSTVKSGPIDISPESIEHIAEFLMGGVGKFIGNIWNTGQRAYNDQEWIPEKTPFLRRVYGKATSESRRRDFYEKWNEVDAAHFQFETYSKAKDFEGMKRVREETPAELAAYEAMRAAQRQISALRKQGDAINLNRELDAVQKEKRLKLLMERENEIILRALKTYAKTKKEKTPAQGTRPPGMMRLGGPRPSGWGIDPADTDGMTNLQIAIERDQMPGKDAIVVQKNRGGRLGDAQRTADDWVDDLENGVPDKFINIPR